MKNARTSKLENEENRGFCPFPYFRIVLTTTEEGPTDLPSQYQSHSSVNSNIHFYL